MSECQGVLNDDQADASQCEEAGDYETVTRKGVVLSDPGCPAYSSWEGIQSRVVLYGDYRGYRFGDDTFWEDDPYQRYERVTECKGGF